MTAPVNTKSLPAKIQSLDVVEGVAIQYDGSRAGPHFGPAERAEILRRYNEFPQLWTVLRDLLNGTCMSVDSPCECDDGSPDPDHVKARAALKQNR